MRPVLAWVGPAVLVAASAAGTAGRAAAPDQVPVGGPVPSASQPRPPAEPRLAQPERDALAARLRSGDDEAKRDAAMALGASGDATVVPVLVGALDDRSEIVRATAAGQLGQLGSADAVGALVDRLSRDKRPFVRKTAAYALGEIGDNSASEALVARLSKEKDKEARAALATALGAIGGDRAAAALAGLLREKDPFLRREAARGLGAIRSVAAVSALLDRLASDGEAEVRRAAAHALGDIGEARARPALEAALHDPDAYVSEEAWQALGRMGAR